jgi:hypothetical protein
MRNIERKIDLSTKFIKMGQALMEEGDDKNDSSISLLGTILIFLGGISLEDDDVYKFSELVSMFSAKKMIESMEKSGHPLFMSMKEDVSNESYDDLAEKLKSLINNGVKNEEEPKKPKKRRKKGDDDEKTE